MSGVLPFGVYSCNPAPRSVKCAGEHPSKECTKKIEIPCKCVHCGGPHPANFKSCPKFPKTGKKGKNSKKKATPANKVQPQPPRTFSDKKVDNRSYSRVATSSNEPIQPPPKTPQNSPVPNNSTDSATGFIKYMVELEGKYPPTRITAAWKVCLPHLKSALSDLDRQFIL